MRNRENRSASLNDIISDPYFSTLGEGTSKWSVLTHNGVVIVPTVKDSTLRLDVTNTSGANWHGELRYSPFAVAAGDTFTVSFAVRARYSFKFSVWLGQRESPHESLVPAENHFGEETMTSEWQTFMHTWKPSLSEEAARLNFVLGPIDNTIEIKNVRLSRINAVGVDGA